MSNLVTTQVSENGNYRIKIYYDETPFCPCTEWDMAFNFLFEYYNGGLHSECSWRELNIDSNVGYALVDALRRLVSMYVPQKKIIEFIKMGKVEDYRIVYNKSNKTWDLEDYWENKWYPHNSFYASDLKDYDFRYELTEFMNKNELIDLIKFGCKDIVIDEFVLKGYGQGDCVNCIAYCTKERYAKMVNTDTTKWKDKLYDILEGEKDSLNRWMWGGVYGFILEEKVEFTKTYKDGTSEEDFEWKEIDSCWGIYEDPEDIIKDYLPNKDVA